MADRSIKVVVSASVTGLVAGMRTAQKATADYAKSAMGYIERNQQALNDVGSAAFKVGAGLTALAGFAVKSAMDWEQAWTGVLKTVDGTPRQLAAIEDGLRDLAVTTGFAHTEVAGVAEAAGQLGISTGGITKFTETMLAMGVSTNLTAADAAIGLARFRNIMGSSEAEIGNMGSSIVALGNNFETTEREILEMSLRLAGAGRQAGLTAADVMGLAASMSSVGIDAEAGGTAMSLTMKRIGKEVETSGNKLDLFARTAGMSVDQFATAWKDNAAGALTAFVAGLGRAESMGMSTNAVLRELGITGIRESDALLRLSANAEGLADALGESSEGWRQNIALMNEADKFYNTTAQKGKQAWAAIKDAAIDAGDSLLPIVAKAAEGVANLAGAFSSLPGPVKGGITAIAGVGGVTLLAVSALIKLATSIQSAHAAFMELQVSGAAGGKVIAGLTRGAAVVTAFAAAQSVAEQAVKRNSKEITGLSKELERFGKTGKTGKTLTEMFGEGLQGKSGRFVRDLRSIGDALKDFDKVGDDIWLTRLGRRLTGPTGNAGLMYMQVEAIKDTDAALAKLARNNPDAAIRAFERIRDSTDGSKASIERLERAFPSMTELLRSASEAMGGTSDASEILNGDLSELAPSAQRSAEEMEALEKRAMGITDAFTGFGKNLDDSKVSLSSWIESIQKQADALRDFTKNTMEAARKGLDEGLIQSLEEAGPAGAMRMKQLADASEKEIARANEAWKSQREAVALAISQMTKVPYDIVTEFKVAGAKDAIDTAVEIAQKYSDLDRGTISTILEALDYSSADIAAVMERLNALDKTTANPKINADTDGAMDKLRAIQRYINGMNGKTLKVHVQGGTPGGLTVNAIGGLHVNGARRFAAGGVDESGRRVPREPQMRDGHQGAVLWGEAETGWEAYISGKPGQEARNQQIWLEAGRRLGMVTAFADGGITVAVSPLELTRLQIRVRDLQRDLKEREKYGKKPKRGQKDRRKTRYVLRGLDRTEAKQELAEAKEELKEARAANKKIPKGKTYKQYNAQLEAAEASRDAASSFAGAASIQTFRSPAQIERDLSRKLAEMAQLTQLLVALKKKGAAPWLLQQLQAAGPSRSTIRVAQAYLADTDALKRVNAQAAQLDAVSSIYGAVTTNAKWESNKAWTGGLTASQTKTLQVNATTVDPSAIAQEVTRRVVHELEGMAMGAGV